MLCCVVFVAVAVADVVVDDIIVDDIIVVCVILLCVLGIRETVEPYHFQFLARGIRPPPTLLLLLQGD